MNAQVKALLERGVVIPAPEAVEVGDEVREGETVGLVGMTGYANGPHVHFNIMVGDNSISPWPAMDGTSGIFDLPYPTDGLDKEE